MTRRTDQDPASGLLHELDTIRTLLDESFREEDIPLLDDPVLDPPALEPLPDRLAQPSAPTGAPLATGQPLLTPELDAAIRDGIDAAIQGWLQDTLPRELDILRDRLLETVRSEIRTRLAAHLNAAHDGDPPPPAAAATEDTHGQ